MMKSFTSGNILAILNLDNHGGHGLFNVQHNINCQLPPNEADVIINISKDEDEEVEACCVAPRSLPTRICPFQAKEVIMQCRLAQQQRLPKIIQAQSKAIHGNNWENANMNENEVSFLSNHKYMVDPPAPGSQVHLARH